MKLTFKTFRTYFIVFIGCFINALGWTAFLIPAKVVGGGISGVATLVFLGTAIPVGITYIAINIFLILIAVKMIGLNFGIKTVFGVSSIAFSLSVLQVLIKNPVVQDDFMATIIGGILAGLGVGIVFTQGGSTGGTDIIAMIVNKYKNISLGRVILIADVFIIASSYIVLGSIEKIVYGYVSMAITSYVIDLAIEGSKQSLQVFIISKNNRLVAERIGNELGRGITFIQGKGWFTNEDKEIAMVLVRKFELNIVLRIVDEIDDSAFVSISSVMGVYGKGFDKLKY